MAVVVKKYFAVKQTDLSSFGNHKPAKKRAR